MGIIENILGAAGRKITGKKLVKVKLPELSEILEREFIEGADKAYLKAVQKTLKPRFFRIFSNKLISKDENWKLTLNLSNNVLIYDKSTKIIYKLKGFRSAQKFYKHTIQLIKAELASRKETK